MPEFEIKIGGFKMKNLNSAKPNVIFITGATSGLGEALAKHYAKEHVILGLVGRNQLKLQKLKQSLKEDLNK